MLVEFTCEVCGKPFTRKPRAKTDYPTRFCGRACWAASRRTDPMGRFWKSVRVEDGDDSCWLWTGRKKGIRYGGISVHGTVVYAHRFSWQVFRGEIPEGLEVCHNCPTGDNPLCVNPAHLFIASHRENVVDAARKGRMQSKLCIESVVSIRNQFENGSSVSDIAAEYGVPANTIRRAIKGETWKHVEAPATEIRRFSKLTEDQVLEIRKKYAEGTTQVALAKEYGVLQGHISKIVLRKNWTHI